MSEKAPIVNPLLKAILEKNVAEMDKLYKQGASLKACNQETFGRILFHVMDNYPVMEWLVQHGLSKMGEYAFKSNEINNDECYTPNGYVWGLSARAYYLKAYDVMELLCAHGFSGFQMGGTNASLVDMQILRAGDERGIKILLENGYCIQNTYFRTYDEYMGCYEKYIVNRPQVKRKTIGLGSKYAPKEPSYEKVPLLFGKKAAETRNRRRKEDYEDNLRAYQEFKASLGEEYDKLVQKEKEDNAILFSAMKEVLKDKGMWNG